MFASQSKDVYPLDKAVKEFNETPQTSTDPAHVAIQAEKATKLYCASNLVTCRAMYLQGLENWEQNEGQRSGLKLPQLPQPILLTYCKDFGVQISPGLIAESDELAILNARPRQ